jgi:hypothetical protein
MKTNKKDNIHLPKKRIKEKKWFEKQITPEQFEIKQDKKGKFYAQHNEWKKTIWIGPYETNEELSKVIASYVSTSKKPFGERKPLKNVHSFIGEVI